MRRVEDDPVAEIRSLERHGEDLREGLGERCFADGTGGDEFGGEIRRSQFERKRGIDGLLRQRERGEDGGETGRAGAGAASCGEAKSWTAGHSSKIARRLRDPLRRSSANA